MSPANDVTWLEDEGESSYESFLNSHVLVRREQELHESWSELTSESLYEKLLNPYVQVKPAQELHKSWWELTSESFYESFLNSRVLVKREQELHESRWELTNESLYESFLNSHVLVKLNQELYESRWKLTDRNEFDNIEPAPCVTDSWSQGSVPVHRCESRPLSSRSESRTLTQSYSETDSQEITPRYGKKQLQENSGRIIVFDGYFPFLVDLKWWILHTKYEFVQSHLPGWVNRHQSRQYQTLWNFHILFDVRSQAMNRRCQSQFPWPFKFE